MLDLLLLVQGVVHMKYGAAGVAPQAGDTFCLKASDEDFRARELFAGCIE
ncbi:hypothetical protein [Variovorax paradoxus]|nr:hypothetical protein [Variovorax paradoxus]UKI12026.1 hypothetical protein L3V85_00135 [Variovorax paradoxus]